MSTHDVALASWWLRLKAGFENSVLARGETWLHPENIFEFQVAAGEFRGFVQVFEEAETADELDGNKKVASFQVHGQVELLGVSDLGRLMRGLGVSKVSQAKSKAELALLEKEALPLSLGTPWEESLMPSLGSRFYTTCECGSAQDPCAHAVPVLLRLVQQFQSEPGSLLRWMGPPVEMARFGEWKGNESKVNPQESGPDAFWDRPLARRECSKESSTSVPAKSPLRKPGSFLKGLPAGSLKIGRKRIETVLQELYEVFTD